MTLPANISSEISVLQTQVTANAPLASAPRAAILAMQLNADELVADTDTALVAAAGALDTWQAPTDPAAIICGILGLEADAENQTSLADCRGVVGRVASNLNQLPS